MAKLLLLSLLEDVLGDFIFGLTKENLKLGSQIKLRFWQAPYYFLSSSLFQNII
jgi:hypothetical protein